MEVKQPNFHSQVEKGVQALLQVIEKTKDAKKQPLFQEDHVVNLQFTLKKVSKQQKIIKLKLPNGLKEERKNVCLFVKDLDKADREFEKSVQYFKTLLKSKGVSCVSEIIPLKALKLEHKPFEAKRNLSDRFDIYLADARIIRLLPSYLGKAFFGRKRFPVQVRMDAKDLKAEFETAINNSRCILTGKGPVGMATVGSTRLSAAELVQNVVTAAEQLVAAVPGGVENIRNFYIKTEDFMAIPVYTSLGSANDVTLLSNAKTQEQVVTDEVTTVENALVKVYPSGTVKLVDESGKLLTQPKKAVKRAGKRGAKQASKKAKRKATAKGQKREQSQGKKKVK